jgi:DNA invertase Pin-like site-specific DNA recombinase
MSSPTQPRTGYPYIRFSTPEQAHGDSYQRQLQIMQRYAAQHNIELDHSLELNDLGVSGLTGANVTTGKLGVFLKAVDSGKVKPGSVLLIEAIDA